MSFGLAAVAFATALLTLQAHGAEDAAKPATPLGKLLAAPQPKKASSVPRSEPTAAQPPLPSFVIPRDTCQQGEPLQALPLAKP